MRCSNNKQGVKLRSMGQASKKQSRGIETRERVLQTTQKLIADHDFHSVTLDQISKQADISKSSLLWHFNSKEELLIEAACLLFKDLEEAVRLEKDDSISLEQKLNSLLQKIGEYFDSNSEPKGVLISLIFNSKIPQAIRKRIDGYWEHHVDSLVHFLSYDEKPFPKDAARAILDVMHGCYIHWYLNKESESFSERLKNSFKFMKFS